MSGQELKLKAKRIKPAQAAGSGMAFATVLMMLGLLLSKITGQLREILVVPVLGYGVVSDAFVIGFQIPDLFYQLLVGGAIQAAITPTLAAAVARGREKQGWRSVSILINITAAMMIGAVIFGQIAAPVLVGIYNRGKEQEIVDLAVRVTRALFPQTFFMMLAALSIGILNAYKKFSSTSFGPSIYNICVILAMLLLGQASPAGAVRVASGVLIAGCVYFLLQFTLARNELKNYTFSFDTKDPGFRRLLKLAVPTLISGSIIQINTIILTGFANQFPGAATSLRQASTTWQLPYGIFVVAIGNVMLPSLAALNASRDKKGSSLLLGRSLRTALFLVLPSAALFLAMQQDVIRGIFQWNTAYSEEAVAITASVLRWYCLAMVAQTFVFLINQAFYARRMTHIALFNGLLTLIFNTGLCLLLTRIEVLGVSALSLAYTITSILSAILLYLLYRKFDLAAAPPRLWPFMIRALTCTTVLLLVVIGLNLLPVQPERKLWQLLWLALRSLIGFAAFLALAWYLKMPELQAAWQKLKRRLQPAR